MTSVGRSSIGWIPGLLGCLLLACSSAHEPVGQTEHGITHGTPADSDPAVVGLVYPLESKHVIGCTGSLVEPRWVLTAAHCVAPFAPDAVVVGSSLAEGQKFSVEYWALHPDFDAATLSSDLALLKLAEPPAVEPLPLWQAEPEPEQVVRIVGFGRSETAAPPHKRQGQARVTTVSTQQFSVEPAPSLSCSGDSGGPAFAGDGETERFVGVASKGDWDCEQRATYTRASAAAEFVDRELTADAHGEGGSCRTTGTPAAAGKNGLLAGVALLLATARRRRRRR